MIAVPHDELRPETLRALIEEFVTRDGAVHGHTETPLEIQMEAVRRQLEAGTIQIVFDEQCETWTIVPVDPRDKARGTVDE